MGGHHGTVADFSADFIVPVIQRFTVSAGRATHLRRKGWRAFGGLRAQVKYRINPQWEVHSYVEFERLLGDAAKSPLVATRGSVNQTTVGIGASYAFDVKIR